MKQKFVQVVKAVGHSAKKQVLGASTSKQLFSSAKSQYEKPPVAEKLQKTSTQIHTELAAVNGGTLFNKHVSKWTKKEAEAFVRIVNACNSIRDATPGSTAAPPPLFTLMSIVAAWLQTSTSDKAQDMKGWLT
jgi:hypothetical protein